MSENRREGFDSHCRTIVSNVRRILYMFRQINSKHVKVT